MLKEPGNTKIEHAVHFNFKTNNNEAEYKALLARIRIAKNLGLSEIEIFIDSQLIYNHIIVGFEVKEKKTTNI